MEYVDRQQGIELTDKDYAELYALDTYIQSKGFFTPSTPLYANGLTVDKIITEYKDVPLDWVIELFK